MLKATIGTISSSSSLLLLLLSAAGTTVLGELGRDGATVWGEPGYRWCTEGHDGGKRARETGGAVTGGAH